MVCTECGARMSEEDQFCPKCGARVIKKRRCPDCGTMLREDNRFCPKCGRLVGEKKSARNVSQDTIDIPMEAIERNILSETAAEIRTDHRPEREPQRSTPRRTSSSQSPSSRQSSSKDRVEKSLSDHDAPVRKKKAEPPVQKRRSQPEPPPKKRRPIYREEIEEDEDWEDEDWDDDDDDEGVDILSIMTAVMGCIVLVIVAFLAFNLYQRYVPKNYEKAARQQEQEEAEQESEDGQGEERQEEESGESQQEVSMGTLVIDKNVNVRDNPATSGTNVIKVAQAGETYEYLEVIGDGDWYKISLSEDGYTEGYVFGEYVSVD